ncbi:DUF3558 domain-containing protein [Amycolatopsis sp. NPDC057786]|uniref:DUF3558 domain-containing protein n=1 Tax=Amycolatopsis sp. NPDC057786 TaxID=3346250 RepID=UPI00366BC7CE
MAEPITDTATVEVEPCGAVSTAEIEAIGGVERTEVDDGTAGKRWLEQPLRKACAGRTLHLQAGRLDRRPPDVIYDNGGEGKGRCVLAVGSRDDLTHTVTPLLTTGNPMLSDPCGMAVRVVSAAIKNLKKS